MSLSTSLPFSICHPWRYMLSHDTVAATISVAFSAKGFNRDYSKAFGAWLVNEKPQLNGVIKDETSGRDSSRSELSCRATRFDGSNQSANIPTGDFDLIDSDGDAFTTHFIFNCDNAASHQNFWSCCKIGQAGIRIYATSATQVRVQYIDANGATQFFAISSGTHDFMNGTWQHITLVYAGGTSGIKVYAKGVLIADEATPVALIASTSQSLAFAVSESLNSDFGQIDASFFGAWKGVAFTAAQIRDLHLNGKAESNEPDVAIRFLGTDIYDTSANRHTVVQAQNPTLSEDKSNPTSPYDPNHAGYTDNAGTLVPAQWGSTTTDAQGNPLQYKGEVARNAQLRNNACISLNGSNQYGVITNSDDFSDQDWTLSGYIEFGSVADCRVISQAGGDSFMLLALQGADWSTYIDNSYQDWSLTQPQTGVPYFFSLQKSGSTFNFSVTNVPTGITETDSQSITMDSRSGNFFVGSNRLGNGNFTDCDVWGLKLDHADGFYCPICEDSGTVSYDVSGNGKNIAWQQNPSWDDQDSFAYPEAKGFSGKYIVTSATDAAVGPEIAGAPIEAGVSISLEIKTSTTSSGILIGNNASMLPWLVAWDADSSSTTLFSSNFTGGTVTVDGVVYTNGVNTRGELASAIPTGEWVKIDISAVDTSSFTNGLFLSGYNSSAWRWDGEVRNLKINGVPYYGTIIPVKEDGFADALGGTIANPAGAWHNGTADINFAPVTDSDSQAAIYHALEFDNTAGSKVVADTNITSFPFSVKADIRITASASNTLLSVSSTSTRYHSLTCNSSRELGILRRGGGSAISNSTGLFLVLDQWNAVEVEFLSETSAKITLDGSSVTLTGLTSATLYASTIDDFYIGQTHSSAALTPQFDIKNVIVKQGDSIINDTPSYADVLGRSTNVFNGENTEANHLSNDPTTLWSDGDPETETLDFDLNSGKEKSFIAIGTK